MSKLKRHATFSTGTRPKLPSLASAGTNCIKIGLAGKLILSRKRSSGNPILLKIVSENRFSGKTYFYTIASSGLRRSDAEGGERGLCRRPRDHDDAGSVAVRGSEDAREVGSCVQMDHTVENAVAFDDLS